MKHVSKIILLFIMFFCFIYEADAKTNQVNIYLFYSDTCSYCESEQVYLKQLEQQYTNIKIYKYEVSSNENNKQLMLKVKSAMGVASNNNVPYTVIGDYSFLGYSESRNSIFTEKIEFYTSNTYLNTAGNILGVTYSVIDNTEDETVVTTTPTATATTKTDLNASSALNSFFNDVKEDMESVYQIITKNIFISLITIASLLTLFACIIIRLTEIKISSKRNQKLKRVNKQFDIKNIEEFIPEFDEPYYKDDFFNVFLEVQKALEEFELETIKNIVSPSMYALLEDNAIKLKENNERIVMEDVEFKDLIFTSIKEDNKDIILECYLRFIGKNYVADLNTNEVIKGLRKDTRFDYKLIFTKYHTETNMPKNCPSCEAPVSETMRECEICGKKLSSKGKFVLSKQIYKKKKILE